jgi:pimeloyl-ACP methyl ester carboxylesterase
MDDATPSESDFEAAAVSTRPPASSARDPSPLDDDGRPRRTKSDTKRRSFRKRALIVLAALGIPVAIVLVVAIVVARGVARKAYFQIQHQELTTSILPADGSARIIEYTTDDGVHLRGALFEPAGAERRSPIVFFHGVTQSVTSDWKVGDLFARTFSTKVFLAELRGYGGTSGEPTEDHFASDARAALDATGWTHGEAILAGWSLGASVAARLASERPCRALLLMSASTSLVAETRLLAHNPKNLDSAEKHASGFSFLVRPGAKLVDTPLLDWLMPDRFDTLAAVRKVKAPVYVVHGELDSVVPPSMGKELAAAAHDGHLISTFAFHETDHDPVVIMELDATLADALDARD